MTIREELTALQARQPELLQAETVVDWASRHPRSATYAALEWDDATAAHEHRLNQARGLIVLYITREDNTPRMVSLSVDRAQPGGGYRPIEQVMATPDLREIALQDALRYLERGQERFSDFRELAEVWDAMERVRQRLARRRRRVA